MLYLTRNIGCFKTDFISLDSNKTTTSTSFVTLLSGTCVTMGNTRLMINVSFSSRDSSSASASDGFRVLIDSAEVTGFRAGTEVYTADQTCAMCILSDYLSEGSHTVELQWHTSSGNTARCRAADTSVNQHASMLVHEVI